MIANTIKRLLNRDRTVRELEKAVNNPDPGVTLPVGGQGEAEAASHDDLVLSEPYSR
jgi:choline/glycine/proline betaine transport protein